MPGPRGGGPAGVSGDEAASGEAGASGATGATGAAATATEPTSPLATEPTSPPATNKLRLTKVARTKSVGTVAAVAALAAAVLLGVGLWLTDGVWWAKSSTSAHREQVRQQVLAAAKTCTAAILSYDYRTLDQNERTGQACATGQLKADYTKLMDTTVKTIAPQNKAVQVLQVAKAGITSVSSDGKQWVILVYGQQSVTTSTVTSPRLDISSASVTLNNVGGVWLVSNMTTTA
jgi:uncharacterized protein HemX